MPISPSVVKSVGYDARDIPPRILGHCVRDNIFHSFFPRARQTRISPFTSERLRDFFRREAKRERDPLPGRSSLELSLKVVFHGEVLHLHRLSRLARFGEKISRQYAGRDKSLARIVWYPPLVGKLRCN